MNYMFIDRIYSFCNLKEWILYNIFTKGDFIANHQIKINIKAINTNGKRAIKISGPTIRQMKVIENKRRIDVINLIDYANKFSSISNSFSYFI